MRRIHRLTALLLCLLLLTTSVFAEQGGQTAPEAEPTVFTDLPTEEETISEAPEALPEETEAAPQAAEAAPLRQAAGPKTKVNVRDLTDAEIVELYNIQNTWSRKALIFAVRNGILKGVGNHNLAPQDSASHAEFATMVARILGTEQTADLSRFTDVQSGDWFYRDMARTVSLGLFPVADRSANTLIPYTAITREEVFVVLARMFGVRGTSKQSLYRFDDWAKVSDWAALELAAMIDAGYVRGAGSNLYPTDTISREELAQVFYNLITRVDTAVPKAKFKGRLALASDTVPAKTTITGDLLLSTDAKTVKLTDVTVTGKLILQGNGLLKLRLNNCSIGHLVVCRDTEVYCTDTTLDTVTNTAVLMLNGKANTVNAYQAAGIPAGASVKTVNVLGEGVYIPVDGKVTKVCVQGKNACIMGSGSIGTLELQATGTSNTCATGKTVENYPKRMVDLVATRTDSGKATGNAPTLVLGLRLTNLPAGKHDCSVKWYVNGELFWSQDRVLLEEGSVLTAQYDFSTFMNGFYSSVPVTAYLTCDEGNFLLHKGTVNLEDSVRVAAARIRTQDVQGKIRVNGTLYSSMELSNAIGSVTGGTQVTVLQSREANATKIRLPNGKVGWVSYYNVAIINDRYYVTTDYSTAVKEYYVNNIRGCSSRTNYLIWVSLYTQRINIFYGYKGNWKLVRSGPISSGRNDCPTPAEVTSILYKTPQWNYEVYYCHHVSVFDEARGFHSRPTAYSGEIYYWDIGYPSSNGCIRLLDEDCIFIYNNCPKGTAVYIY